MDEGGGGGGVELQLAVGADALAFTPLGSTVLEPDLNEFLNIVIVLQRVKASYIEFTLDN